ncbi:MAG: glycosyltransferase [Kiritimatiellaeota bacterium]|nr:glycosyltransferase [Kiritimatiellota bacterium]
MRILFFIIDLDSGGAEWQLARLADYLNESGVVVKVVCMRGPNETYEWLEKSSVDVECLGYDSPARLSRLLRFAKIAREFKPDILHTWMFHANFAGKLIGRWRGVRRIVASLRVAEKERWHHVFLERWTSWLNAKILCNSNGLAKFAESRGFPVGKLEVIPNSFDASLFSYSKRSRPRNSRWRVLFLGRAATQKGLPYLLDASRLLADDGVDFHLDIIGDLQCESVGDPLVKLAERNGISGRVSFTPSVAHDKIPEVMTEHHFLVLPSLWEGMPNVVMEAFASGLPVVGTDIEGTSDLVTDGETGLLAAPADAASLAGKMKWVIENYDEASSMAEKAFRLVREKHSPDLINARYLDFYRKLVGEEVEAR